MELSGIILPMEPGVISHQARTYTVLTQVYEGPLDLLLQLIERAELDVTKLAIAQVTDQYLQHLQTIQQHPVEEVSAFLVIATRLIQIKSEVLLPRPVIREEGEEDPGEALALQLRAYKRFKEIAILLGEREQAGLRTYLRLAPPPKMEGTLDLSGIGLQDLVDSARRVFAAAEKRQPLNTVVAAPRVTIREKISLIARHLRSHGRSTFRALLKARTSNLDVVVTFLAMLELIKRHLVRVHQESLFGDIQLEREEDWNEEETFELEFGE